MVEKDEKDYILSGREASEMTISDIAKMAGVSNAAVSRYLNGGSLSAEKRAAIHAVVEQTGYRPDAAAQTLRTGRINQVGVITPSISSQSVALIVSGISGELDANNYMVLLGSAAWQERRELNYLTMMQHNHVSGIILMGTVYTPAHAQAFRECRVPLVVTGQRFPDVPCVYNDDRSATRELTERMLRRGRRKIVYIGGPERDIAMGRERRLGVQEALDAAGRDGGHLPFICCERFELKCGYDCMTALLNRCPDLDGVVCVTDTVALGALRALREAGRHVGEDVSLAGIGDSWADTVAEPGLTTIRFYQDQVGTEAARMLLQMIGERGGEERPVRQISMGYTVVERGSI